ncbi:peptide/nickel transport system permease protein/oligopeptide transport system permease protein [Orenia metallireducens]|jgi:peptide/nickel transport system permease protein/oligopeptide transport system permease protein|uniref:Peptide/nickel transport system permease protein/oligopeptide transport system permease protein n=1 Tax=Orenia metallireducens TaxID=1413210 RepID=A0A285GTZ5_9FIRM|nr:ABC transporter permease [Orenia metallireducens]PRX32650.1 peptide/nickel transport system permease protein/oligopeptide transport system permease protein [Orenia metallireducens]SNY26724.1 peptide/nickel transport system permease protein/oligopeptide transport system permease protein [Orenia metallireducens]
MEAQVEIKDNIKASSEEVHSPWRDAWRRLKKNKIAMVGLYVTIALILVAVFARWIAPYDPYFSPVMEEGKIELSMQGPSLEHPFGTDKLGRDIFSRIIYGAQISLTVGFITQAIAIVIGIVLGALAGYYSGLVDDIISYLINVFLAFPFMLFAIAIMAVFQDPGIEKIFVALGLISWPGLARIVRGQVMALKEEEYVEAAKSLGANDFRIIFKHVIPNTLAPIIVTVTLGVASAILAEAGLSFLGLGAQPPTPSWGLMLSTGKEYLRSYPRMMMFPGAAIMITVLAFNIFGDGLRDALDPKMKDK